jgi:acyl-CoA hydrolase
MHITVEVSAIEPKTGDRKTTTRCLIVFVAVDGGGDTVSVPAWNPETAADTQLEQYARQMAKARKDQENEILAVIPH